ncbi:DUF2911 domain-containing protein [Bizionia argentinensis JUB59]|uniref:DUF2911 domain-containing protein n=1 Tax=Bizionia argentinensis JUB59 TaxID=1046627 RepID=G2ECH4_9FLAO|nr:DUF2911 domain-containing protein [Bizionia argentinensis]EGV43840.1 DUF2911 domain-containing protein [Bizionia argentinensis JUB59]
MKKSLLLIAVFVFAFAVHAQVTTPEQSPFSKVEQKVGLTDVTIEYSRPGVKERKIFGDLEAYDAIWRTGANKNTIITFSDPVTVGGYKLEPGSYSLFTKPGESMWEVYFYTDTDNWGAPEKWDDSKVAAIAKVKVEKTPFVVETFTIDINNIQTGSATLEMMWENTYIAIPFTVPTDDLVLKSINEALNGTPKASDYYAAAVYYLNEGKDVKQSKEWIDKAMSMTDKPAFYQLRQQALIYAKAGDTQGAIKLAKESTIAAKAAGNMQYVRFNEASLKEWGAN